MKILNLKIISPDNSICREVEFNPCGATYIYGQTENPKQNNETINSVGKTMLLQFIDFCFGKRIKKDMIDPAIISYSIRGEILFGGRIYNIVRSFREKDRNLVTIDGETISLEEYKKRFSIDRNLLKKQIVLSSRNSELSDNISPKEEDVLAYIELLNLEGMVDTISKIYSYQNEIERIKKLKKVDLPRFYGKDSIKKLEEEIYYVDKKIGEIEEKLEKEKEKIKKLSITELEDEVLKSYNENRAFIKKELNLKSDLEAEYERLKRFIEESKRDGITSSQVLELFDRVNQEILGMIKKRIEDVENFHNQVYEERRAFLKSKLEVLREEIEKKNDVIREVNNSNQKIEAILADNKVYSEVVELYELKSEELTELKYKQGELSQIKNFDSRIKENDDKLTILFAELKNQLEKYESLIEEYRDFLYYFTKKMYKERDISSYFDITVGDKHQKNRPLSISINLTADSGEGIGEVKKNLIDFLVFKYNNNLDFLIQDSSCYNGIDPRQVSFMLLAAAEIAEEKNKQHIVSINKYQIAGKEAEEFVKNRSALILTENDMLLGFKF